MHFIFGFFRFIFLVCLIPLVTLGAVLLFPRFGEEAYRRQVQLWARAILRLIGIRVKVSGVPLQRSENGGKGFLLLSNHLTFLDIFAIDAAQCSRFVAKAEIGKWPCFGAIARCVKTIFIERGRKRAILDIARKMEEALLAGENVIFFPEGTVGPGGCLLPLHANLIEAAVRTGAPLQPLVLRYTSRGERTDRVSYYGDISLFQCLWNIVTTPDAAVEVIGLEPIAAEGRNRHELCSEVSEKMAAALGVPDPGKETKKLN